jgi:hypothetical protein
MVSDPAANLSSSHHRNRWRQDMIRISIRARATAAVLLAAVTAFAASPVFATDGVATLGSPPPQSEQAGEVTPPADPMDALLDYAACMREHGIDMPDPQITGGGFVMEFQVAADGEPSMGTPEDLFGEEFMVAEEACSGLLGAMTSEQDPAAEAEIMEAMLAHADCMRKHGIDVPDPSFSEGMIVMGGPEFDGAADTIDFFSDEYVAAEEACRDVLPFGDDGFGFADLSNP